MACPVQLYTQNDRDRSTATIRSLLFTHSAPVTDRLLYVQPQKARETRTHANVDLFYSKRGKREKGKEKKKTSAGKLPGFIRGASIYSPRQGKRPRLGCHRASIFA